MRRVETLHRRAVQRDSLSSAARSLSTGIEALDRLLPEKGLACGTLSEWLFEGAGSGASWLALKIAVHGLARRHGRAVVLIDPAREFNPSAAAALGLNLDDVLVVHPRRAADNLWTLEQSLRCPAVAATLVPLERIDDRAFRRLQLAAETGGGLGFLLRPTAAQREPSWAAVRFLVVPQAAASDPFQNPHLNSPREREGRRLPPVHGGTEGGPTRRLRLTILSLHGGSAGASIELEIDDETGVVRVAPSLAAATAVQRAARA